MSEFQIASYQELIDTVIDAALASALVAYGGDVSLLLPVLRPDVRALFGHPEFVAKVHEFVSARSQDTRYRRAFAQGQVTRESMPLADPSPPTNSSRARTTRYSADAWQVLRATLIRYWHSITKVAMWVVTPVAPTAEPIASKPKPELDDEPAVESPAPSCGATIKFQVVIKARCVDGRQIDEDGVDRGLCPSCLAAKGTS